MITTTEAAALLGISTRRVRQLAEAGRLTGRKMGRDWMLDEESVTAHKPKPIGRPKKDPA